MRLHALAALAFQRAERDYVNDLIKKGVKFEDYFKNKWQISDENWEEFQLEAQTLVSFPTNNPWEDFTTVAYEFYRHYWCPNTAQKFFCFALSLSLLIHLRV